LQGIYGRNGGGRETQSTSNGEEKEQVLSVEETNRQLGSNTGRRGQFSSVPGGNDFVRRIGLI